MMNENSIKSVQKLINKYENHTPSTSRATSPFSLLSSDTEWEQDDIFSEGESNGTLGSEEIFNTEDYKNEYENEIGIYKLHELHEHPTRVDANNRNNSKDKMFQLRKTLDYIEWVHQQTNKNFQYIEHTTDRMIIRKRSNITNKVMIITVLMFYGYPILKLLPS